MTQHLQARISFQQRRTSAGALDAIQIGGERQAFLRGAEQAARLEVALEGEVEHGVEVLRRKPVELQLASDTAVWYHPGVPVVPLRWVLIRDPAGQLEPQALLSTDPAVQPRQIVAWFVLRWQLEVTFEEGRAQLGLETQRQWSDQAIARTTPVLLSLFSLVTLLALQLSHNGQIPVPVTAWYYKAEPTFSDCLGLVRQHLWRARYLVHSTPEAECRQFPQEALDLLIYGLSLAA